MTQKSVGDCCLCIPLRFGVGLICMYQFIHAFICIFCLFSSDIRFQSGGYNQQTERFQVFLGSFGLIFAISGLLGVYDNKAPWVRTFNYFQFAKLAALVIVFGADMYTLSHCDTWYNKINSQVEYNAALDTISKKGLCEWVRQSYALGWLLDITINAYFCYVSHSYCLFMERSPAYLINLGGQKDHLQVTMFDERIGEPINYLGPPLQRTTDSYGSA